MSSLRSVRSMLGRVYPNLGREQGGQPAAIGREQPGGDMAPLLAAGYVVDLVEPCVAHIHQEFTRDMVHTLTQRSPFTSSNTYVSGPTADLLDLFTKRVCGAVSIALCVVYVFVMATDHTHHRLLTLLGDPVVSYNLQPKRLDSESKRAVEAIMVGTAVAVHVEL